MARRCVPVGLAAALLLAAALAAAACGIATGDSSGGGGAGPADLQGATWRLTGWSVSGQDPSDFTITAGFKDGRIGGTSAVNQYGGPYSAGDDGSFTVGDLVSTMMAGPEPDMQAEQKYMALLAAARSFAVSGDTLTLSDDSGSASLIFTRSTASPAVDGT